MDIKHHYIEKGRGEALVLLHGNGEDSSYFSAQLEPFSKYYRVIAPDTRGHGLTPRGNGEFSIARFAGDLKCFFERLGLEKAHILGFSDGANIAMVFALRYPHMVDRLVLNGGNLCAGGVKASVQLPITLGYKAASLFAKKSEAALKNAEMLGLMVNDPDLLPRQLEDIKAATLVIAGSRDMIKEEHTRLIAASIPNSVLKIIEGDHFIAAKKWEVFNPTVLDFLRAGETENEHI